MREIRMAADDLIRVEVVNPTRGKAVRRACRSERNCLRARRLLRSISSEATVRIVGIAECRSDLPRNTRRDWIGETDRLVLRRERDGDRPGDVCWIGYDSSEQSIVGAVVIQREAVMRERRLKQHERIDRQWRGAVWSGSGRRDETAAEAVASEVNRQRVRTRRRTVLPNALEYLAHTSLSDRAGAVLHLIVRDEIGETPRTVGHFAEPIAEPRRSTARRRGAH